MVNDQTRIWYIPRLLLGLGLVSFGILTLRLSYQDLFQEPEEQDSPNIAPFSQPTNIVRRGNTSATQRLRKSDGPRPRSERFIIFDGNGVIKLVLGISFPIRLADKQRSLTYFYNLQLQYTPAPTPVYWWWSNVAHKQRSADQLLLHDDSRSSLYAAIETILKRFAEPSSECLLRIICEFGRASLHEDGRNDIFHALLNAIFMPTLPNVDAKYLDARRAGLAGANCELTFGACVQPMELLKRITRLL